MNTIVDYDCKKCPVPSREDERRLLRRAQAGDREAEEYLIRANLRFAYQYARKLRWRGEILDDFLQEAAINLSTAIHRFDLKTNYRFITYASWWVRQAAGMIRRKSSRVSVPVWAMDALMQYRRRCDRLGLKADAPETLAEVGAETGLTERQQQCLIDLAALLKRSHEECRESSVPDREHEEQDDLGEGQENFERIMAIKFPDKRMADILRGRFERNETLRVIGERHGISKERVRQIIQQGLEWLLDRVLL